MEIIRGVIPGTAVKSPVAIAVRNAAEEVAGRPALMTAAGTSAGMVLPRRLVKTTTYTDAATVEMALRSEPAIPTAVPISCWSSSSIPAFVRQRDSFHPMKKDAEAIRHDEPT